MKDPLFFNKFAFCVLFALLLFFGLPQLANAILGGGHHGGHHGELKLAYPIDYSSQTSGDGAPKEEKSLAELLSAANPTAGERRAAICASCHTFVRDGANGTGPNLWDIVGRPVAQTAGFNYSGALQEFGGEWTFERLDKYLENSQGYIPGTAMVQRFPKAQQRADLIAWLAQLSDSPMALPEPVAAPVEEEAHGADHGG